MHYLKTWFFIDCVSTIPYDVIVFFLVQNDMVGNDASSLSVLRMLKLLKLTKLLRIMKSVSVFRTISARLNLTNAMSDLIFYFIIVMMTMHWGACFWRMVPEYGSDGRRSWINEAQLDHLHESGSTITDATTLFGEHHFSIVVDGI